MSGTAERLGRKIPTAQDLAAVVQALHEFQAAPAAGPAATPAPRVAGPAAAPAS